MTKRSLALSTTHAATAWGTGLTATLTPGVPSGWKIFWVAYAVVGLVVEGVALARRAPGDTASETVWWLRGATNGWRAFAILAACIWLALHFAFGWFS